MEKINIKLITKRVLAYMLDIIFVTLFSMFLASVPELKDEYDEYQKVYNEFEVIYTEYMDINILLNDLYKDESIEQEEYNELIKTERYKSIIEDKYQDQIIDESEYKEIINQIKEEYDIQAEKYNYKMQKKGSFNTIITLISTLLYFGVLQYFCKGQTIGKKIMHMQIISANDKKINILNYLLRSLIINNVLLNSINVTFLILANKNLFYKVDNIISLSISMIEAITIFLLITREDNRGLHDLICNTKVIYNKEEKTKNEKPQLTK